jgi:ABC-type multidrug transport system fused ATPase/permease subunit
MPNEEHTLCIIFYKVHCEGQYLSVLRRLLEFAVPYWKIYLVTGLLVLSVTGLTLLEPMIIRWTVDEVIELGRWELLIYGASTLIIVSLVRAGLSFLQRYAQSWAGQRVIFDIRNTMYRHLQQMSYSFYDTTQTGQLMSRVTSDVQTCQRFLSNGLVQTVSSTLTFVGTFGLMLNLNWKLALVTVLTLPFLVRRVQVYSTEIRPMFREIQQKLAVLTSTIQQNITGQRVIKAFVRKEYEVEKFDRDNTDLLNSNVKAIRSQAFNESLMQFLSEASLALILGYGGFLVIINDLSLGTLLAFNTLLGRLLRPVRMLGFLVSLAQRTVASAQRVYEILDTKADIEEKDTAVALPDIKGSVQFDNVSFSYDDENMVLKNINLKVNPGETIAILGRTGSGKSTLLNLIPRFYDVSEGRITIDGYDVRDVTLDSLRTQIGVVTQETFLFSASLRDNIAYGRPNASLEEVRKAAQSAHISDFIENLPHGYDTLIGERGVGLSGGQKQRIAIARALLLDAKILLLDESTSSVDVETEMQIQKAFQSLLADRTGFIIAQRLSTIRNADKIIVLDDGRIAEEGTHEELLAKGGIYTGIYDLQFRGQEGLNV